MSDPMPEAVTNPMSGQNSEKCPLCLSKAQKVYYSDNRRNYLQCQQCALVSVPQYYHLSADAEKAEYDKHQNDPADPGYRQFLARTTNPLFTRLKQKQTGAMDADVLKGLDFGCGPGPAIWLMAKEQGFSVVNYDLYYFNNKALLSQQYDFVTLTEVIEHIARPAELLPVLGSLLKPGAIMAVMTKRVVSQQAFKNWHYKNDNTHINFYSEQTFQWIAQKMGWRLEIVDKDVVFFYKNGV